MLSARQLSRLLPLLLLLVCACGARAQSFKVQCPFATTLHPLVNANGVVTGTSADKYPNPHIKCQQISGGDGFATMADGTQTYLFSFGPLSGLKDIVNGLPGTQTAAEFNQNNVDSAGNVLDVIKIGAPDGPAYPFNGAIGLVPDQGGSGSGATAAATLAAGSGPRGVGAIAVTAGGTAYKYPKVTLNGNGSGAAAVANFNAAGVITSITVTSPGSGYTAAPAVTIGDFTNLDGHVDPRLIMDVGVLNGNIPAPMIAIDEGDELFLTLTNVGQVMRPDLFEQHTVHFHGYPNASAFYDGVPDASVAINVGGSFTYYYLAPEAGTYMWHCHISPPEHLQMGMVGQLYVRPRQTSVAPNGSLYGALSALQSNPETKCASTDVLCSTQLPPTNTAQRAADASSPPKPVGGYAYNDGDGSTYFDVEYPIQMMGFDPNFHFVGMTFNPESFADNKDKYFLLNGRSYPDTINPNPLSTQVTDGTPHFSQPLPTIINIPANGRALLRISDLNVTEYHTLASLGIRMHVVGYNARLLRDQDGANMDYYTNSISLAGGESVDVILDANGLSPGQKFYLYTPQMDHLSNDAENFGGMMTEVNICSGKVDPLTKKCL
jgi:FtsP/CotA-like multicopper oxidase with cupredoxin domain